MVKRPPAGSIPDAPGSYQFFDAQGRVIYVGKAKSLRSRLSNYFQNPQNLHPRTAQMVATADHVEWIQVDTNVEALMLEYNLIKEHLPRFNIRLIDDKSYPYLAVTVGAEWPRPMVMRGKKRKGTRYFGPYAHAWAIRDTLDSLLRVFPVRSCTDNKLDRHAKLGKPCLLFHIEKCSAPCVGEVSREEYDQMVADLLQFLEGDTDAVLNELETRMHEAADALEFEQAARLRDRMGAVQRTIEKQQMVGDRSDDMDVIGVAEDDLEACVFVFYVRRGRVTGRRSFIIDKVEPLSGAEVIDKVLESVYDEEPVQGMPKTVLLPNTGSDPELYTEWLSVLRGSKVELRQPQRGEKVDLLAMVTKNAEEEFTRHRMKRATDHNSRARALNELQEYLGLPVAPLRIECYDMSHIQGTDYVGSMVVVEDGLPAKNQYRRFKIKTVDQNDDFAAMEEVLTRRLTAYKVDKEKPVSERGKFQYPPQLLVVDGGKGQLSRAIKVLQDLDLFDEIPCVSLAKQFEEIFVPHESESIRLPRQSEALYLMQRIRDESHRFAITYHRQLRDKRMTKSVLDDIPGLGPARQKRLVKEMGSVKKVKQASIEELRSLTWLPDVVAEAVFEKVHS
ncbi:MAG: excinuclease ABC subunit UvrC [Acidimicrobiales bacterium]|nr:excinuclease ABC subunit UvrC [Acidimicrobiales bacterium]